MYIPVATVMVAIINDYIKDYDVGMPIILRDIYDEFPKIKKGTVRQAMKRLYDKQVIERAKHGVYFKPDPNRILKNSVLSTNKIIEAKYLIKDEKIVGYKTGLYFANKIGLTSQMASVESIVSNNVSNRKRSVNINNIRVIVNAPRVIVTNDNYKLLQVLDLINDFKKMSEFTLTEALPTIINYLNGVKLTKKQIVTCVDAYPLATQVTFYKMGILSERNT